MSIKFAALGLTCAEVKSSRVKSSHKSDLTWLAAVCDLTWLGSHNWLTWLDLQSQVKDLQVTASHYKSSIKILVYAHVYELNRAPKHSKCIFSRLKAFSSVILTVEGQLIATISLVCHILK